MWRTVPPPEAMAVALKKRAPASRSWPIGPCYTLREDAPHHDLKASDTVITSPEPGWRDDGLYVIRLMGDDGEVPHVASQIK